MKHKCDILANGNLATARRTISGLLGQIAIFRCSKDDALRFITDAGLPASAYEDPDFPISLEQDLAICCALVSSLNPQKSPVTLLFSVKDWLGVESLGVLGMAMRNACSHKEATRLFLRYPQLGWGHCRLLITKDCDHISYEFTIDRPTLRATSELDIDRLIQYCVTLDLVSVAQITQELLVNGGQPIDVALPYPRPTDWNPDSMLCPVIFDADIARVRYPNSLTESRLPHSRPTLFKNYSRLAEKLSQMLVDDISVAERVSRWLWAHTPPLGRAEIANILSMSERNLTRKLSAEGTSFSELLGSVQDQRGKNLLRNANLTIAEIAYRLGYADPATFTRAFSRHNGMAPKKWRQNQL